MTVSDLVAKLRAIETQHPDAVVSIYGRPFVVVGVGSALWRDGVHCLIEIEEKKL